MPTELLIVTCLNNTTLQIQKKMFYQIVFLGLYLEFVRSTSTAPGFYISYNVEESRAIELKYSEACQECANLGLSIAKIDDNSTFNRAKEYVTTFQVTFNWNGDLFWVDANSTVDENKCTLISDDILTKETCDTKAYVLCQGFIYEQVVKKTWIMANNDCKLKGAELSQLKTQTQRTAAAQHVTVMNNISLKMEQPNGVWFGLQRKLNGKLLYLDGTEDDDISGYGIYCVKFRSYSDGTFDIERNGCLGKLLYICSMGDLDYFSPTTQGPTNQPLQDDQTTSLEMSTKSNWQGVVWPTTAENIKIPSEDETTTTSEISTMKAEQEVFLPATAETINLTSEDETTTSSEMSTKSNGQEVVWPTTAETMNIPSEDETTTSSEMSTMTTKQEVILPTTAETINIPSEDDTTTSSEMSTMTTEQEAVSPTTAETINIPSEDETTTSSELMVDDDNKETAKRQQEIKEALQLNAKTTVLALNKKICAEDNRPSAVALGSVAGICVITIVLAIIIIPDLPRLWEHVTNGVPYEDKKRQKKE